MQKPGFISQLVFGTVSVSLFHFYVTSGIPYLYFSLQVSADFCECFISHIHSCDLPASETARSGMHLCSVLCGTSSACKGFLVPSSIVLQYNCEGRMLELILPSLNRLLSSPPPRRSRRRCLRPLSGLPPRILLSGDAPPTCLMTSHALPRDKDGSFVPPVNFTCNNGMIVTVHVIVGTDIRPGSSRTELS